MNEDGKILRSKKQKCLPQAQHMHFGCAATRCCDHWQLVNK